MRRAMPHSFQGPERCGAGLVLQEAAGSHRGVSEERSQARKLLLQATDLGGEAGST
jgi:hypothetical protein